ncbi:hypothetical protein [Parapedobacter sp. DT-150]|uniref:hypothetical protein n=1 Tax=Parapedobacter sp. DT-150 TaxID=3396162 RepID=UPI003F1A4649
MKIHTNMVDSRMFYRVITLAAAAIIMACQTSKAQFTIIDDLRGNNYPDIVVGGPGGTQGTAYLTSGIDDPVGSGWLRLTRDQTNQRGYAYIDRSFPSGMGVLIDFEYKMWRTGSSHTGADGLSVFLFDADEEFRLGGYGGSLGYAPNTNSNPPVTQGLAGGYIGVGLDAYGNFSNPFNDPSEGRNGGPGEEPNSVVLRGPTTDDSNTTNEFLTSTLLGDREGDNGEIRQRGEVDYDIPTITRPSSDDFYRRVQITVLDVEDVNGELRYEITVRWSRSPGGAFEHLITYTTDEPPPQRMKVGFAASTGADLNFHEIRNILVTTLGNLRTIKLADKDFLIPTNAGGGGANENKITYTIEVVNDTNAPIEGIVLRDTIKDAYGNVLSPETFTIDPGSITVLNPDVLTVESDIEETTTNIIQGTVSIAAGETGLIQVTGTLHQTPPGNHIINTVLLDLPDGTDYDDEDPLNNTYSWRTPVYADGVDLILGDIIPDGRCIDYVNGNTFTVQVSNMGTDDLNVASSDPNKRITVTITHPPGTVFTPLQPTPEEVKWTLTNNSPTSHTYRLTNPSKNILPRGFTHPDLIRFRLTSELTDIPTRDEYTVNAIVDQFNDNDDDNDGNNISTASLHNCAIISNPMIYQRVKWWP